MQSIFFSFKFFCCIANLMYTIYKTIFQFRDVKPKFQFKVMGSSLFHSFKVLNCFGFSINVKMTHFKGLVNEWFAIIELPQRLKRAQYILFVYSDH